MPKYAFGWNERAAVECPAMDSFINDLAAVCEKHGAGFEMESYSDGGGYLVVVPYKSADFTIFSGHLDEYRGGIPWLDEAKARYDKAREEWNAESQRQEAIRREADDRATYERLKRKYGMKLTEG